jgi:hypothetical protein
MSDTSSQQQAFHDHPKHPPLLLVLTDDDVHFTSHQQEKTPRRFYSLQYTSSAG